MITRIELYNYRLFSKIDIPLTEYQVFAGANGSGKSTLLDIPILLGDLLTSRKIGDAFLKSTESRKSSRSKTFKEIVHCTQGNHFTIIVEVALPVEVVKSLLEVIPSANKRMVKNWPNHLRYELQFEIFNENQLQVGGEFLGLFSGTESTHPHGNGVLADILPKSPKLWLPIIFRRRGAVTKVFPEGKGKALGYVFGPEQIALANIPYDRKLFPATTWFQDFLRDQTRFFQPGLNTLKEPSPPGKHDELDRDGSNLAWFLLDLEKKDPDGYAEWVEHVHQTLPQIKALGAREREDDHHAYLWVEYEGGYELSGPSLSDGTLRIIGYTALPFITYQPRTLVIEEPENGVHPRAVEFILDALKAMRDSQVMVTTQSPIVLAQTERKNVMCMRRGEGSEVNVVPGLEHPHLQDWQGKIDLGSLFAAGVLE